MAGEWVEAPLGDLVRNLDSRRVPLSSRERERRRGRFPYFGATGVMDYVDDYLFEGLHLLVAEDGSVERPDGMPFVQLVDGRFWVNNHAHVLRAHTDEDTRFLYYALQTVPIRPFMSGSVQAKLSQANLNKIPIPYPTDGAERRAIAHILGTLDDKIELNRRMSETLEAMAQALFKSWFVDFDPVRAKMEGRWRKHSPLPLGEGSGVREQPRPNPELLAFARELRLQSTNAEQLLWRLLRKRQVAGAKFRRQHPMPPYILDFYCHEGKLAIELDGGQHNEPTRKQKDAERDALLAEQGIRVLRFWNREVLGETEAVLEAIHAALVESLPSPQPLSRGERGFYLPAHLYDLFPDRLVASELGEIPEGGRLVLSVASLKSA